MCLRQPRREKTDLGGHAASVCVGLIIFLVLIGPLALGIVAIRTANDLSSWDHVRITDDTWHNYTCMNMINDTFASGLADSEQMLIAESWRGLVEATKVGLMLGLRFRPIAGLDRSRISDLDLTCPDVWYPRHWGGGSVHIGLDSVQNGGEELV